MRDAARAVDARVKEGELGIRTALYDISGQAAAQRDAIRAQAATAELGVRTSLYDIAGYAATQRDAMLGEVRGFRLDNAEDTKESELGIRTAMYDIAGYAGGQRYETNNEIRALREDLRAEAQRSREQMVSSEQVVKAAVDLISAFLQRVSGNGQPYLLTKAFE